MALLDSINNFIQNALTGKLTPSQLGQIKQQTAADITRAGGSSDVVRRAMDEINAVNALNEPPAGGAAGIVTLLLIVAAILMVLIIASQHGWIRR